MTHLTTLYALKTCPPKHKEPSPPYTHTHTPPPPPPPSPPLPPPPQQQQQTNKNPPNDKVYEDNGRRPLHLDEDHYT